MMEATTEVSCALIPDDTTRWPRVASRRADLVHGISTVVHRFRNRIGSRLIRFVHEGNRSDLACG